MEFLALHDYTEGLLIFTVLFTFIFSLRHYDRHRAFRIIPYYIGLCGILTGAECYYYISPNDRFALTFDTIITVTFTIVEFCVFNLLILHYITGAGRRLAIKVNAVLFFGGEIVAYIRAFPRNPVISMVIVEGIALLSPCAIYFYEFFTNMNTKALKDRPSFWIVTAIIYQSVGAGALLLSKEYMGRFGDGAYALGNVFYCILFVLFMRAYKCSPEELAVG